MKNKIFILAAMAFVVLSVGIAKSNVGAQTASAYSMMNGTITASDANAGTVTVTTISRGIQLGAPCYTGPSGTVCPGSTATPPVTVTWAQVLTIDNSDQVIPAFSDLTVGDHVALYMKTSGGAATPYALKDYNFPLGTKTGTVIGGTASSSSGVVNGNPLGAGISASGYLTVGNSGSGVLAVQEKLQALGYFPSNTAPSGYFGSVTIGAVKAYQSAQGLPSTGLVGPLTTKALGL